MSYVTQNNESSNDDKSNAWLIVGVGAGLAVAIAALLFVLWKFVLRVAFNSLIPWLESKKHLGRLAEIFKEAFVALDLRVTAVNDNIRRVWDNWSKARMLLLKQTVEIKMDGNKPIQKVENWLVDPTNTTQVEHETHESPVDWRDLPADIRMALIEKQEHVVNVTKTRDDEFAKLGLTY